MRTYILDSYFIHGHAPTLKYITKQTVGENWIDRPIHTHTETAELIIIADGTAIYNLDCVNYTLHKGDIVLSNPGVPHEIQALPSDPLDVYTFGFTDFTRPGSPKNHLLPEGEYPVRRNDEEFPLLSAMCTYLFHKEKNPVFYSMLSSVLVMALETPLAKNSSFEDDDTDSVVAQRTKDYIDQNYAESFTLEDIASALSYSAPYISHSFKAVMGYSPMKYQTRCRIGAAQSYLIETDLSATQIATMVGYNNTNYFTTVFTKMVGSSPIQYRKDYLKRINKNM